MTGAPGAVSQRLHCQLCPTCQTDYDGMRRYRKIDIPFQMIFEMRFNLDGDKTDHHILSPST